MSPLQVAFVGGSTGTWGIERLETVAGSPLAPASRLAVVEGSRAAGPAGDAAWVLRGVTSNERYATSDEHQELAARQEPLGRAGSTRAALIPVRKSEAWWDLAQDERRRIFEESSHHIATGLEYLPAVAQRLHHGRDLGEPFDFLTWFEFAPEHAAALKNWCGGCEAPKNGPTSNARSTSASPGKASQQFARSPVSPADGK